MKATANFKIAKQTKRMMALMFKTALERNAFKNIMISVEIMESNRVKTGT